MDLKQPPRSALEPSPPFSHDYSNDKTTPLKDDLLPHWDSLDLCNAPGNASHHLGRKRRKEEGLFSSLRSWIVHNQTGLAINLLLLLALTHLFFPSARQTTRTFFKLSYYDPAAGRYTRGPKDFFFVLYWIVIFTGLRAATLSYLLLPFAQWAGIDKPKSQTRFAEQAWLFLYYSVFWSLGMYIMYNSRYWLNLPELWTDFPVTHMDGLFKWYYLVQFAFWVQQIVIVNIEERRKDHWQMFTHHIVTCMLMFTSYGYYQTKTGNVILCIMDIVDLTLPAAKMLKYAGYQKLCDVAFGIFILSWIAARHVCYLMVCYSVYFDVPKVMTPGCYSTTTGEMLSPDGGSDLLTQIVQPFTDPGGPVCYHLRMRVVFLSMLLALQGITIVWLTMILRVAWNVIIKGTPADDSRSDDEAEAEDAGDEGPLSEELPLEPHASTPTPIPRKQPVEETVGVDGLNFQRKGSPRYRSRKSANGSGVSIAGHSDRKELLGRIGCDKPST